MPIATPSLIAVFSFDAGTVAGWTAGNSGNRYFDSVSTPAALSLGGSDYALSFTGTGIRNAELTTASLGSVTAAVSVQPIVFPSALPSNSPDVFIGGTTADQVFVFFDQPTGKFKATWAGGSAVTGTHTLAHSTTYLLETYVDSSANPNRLKWRVNGVDQPDATSAVAAGNVTQWLLGRDGNVAGAYYFPYAALSVTAADWPLGPLRIPMLVPDPGGTITVNGSTSNFGLFSGATPTEAAWNAATALSNLSSIPAVFAAAGSKGVYQIARTDNSHYIEIPMTSTTLADGEQVAGAQLDIIGAAVTTTAATIGFRTYNGTTERTLFPAGDPNFDNSSTPAWIRRMLTLADVDTQAELDALCVRMGFATDVSPHVGMHRTYINVAIRLVTSGAVGGTLPALTGSMAGTVAAGSVTGTVAGVLPPLTGSASGTVSVTGTLSGQLPSLTGSAVGIVSARGTLAGNLPALTGAAVGRVTAAGQLIGNLPALTGSMAGRIGISGTAAGLLPTLTGVLTGRTGITGTVSGLLPTLVGSTAGRIGIAGSASGTLPALTGALTGSVATGSVAGAVIGTLPALTGSMTGVALIVPGTLRASTSTPGLSTRNTDGLTASTTPTSTLTTG